MTAFAVSVDLFDPTGPDRMAEGDAYGGETRLFVLSADTLDAALRKLVAAVESRDTRVDRLHKAAPAPAFTAEDFPFEVDIAAMVADAESQGRICVTPDYTFSPYGNNETGVFYGMFEFFDPARTGTGPYAGEFTHAARRASSCGQALLAVLDELADDRCSLKTVEDFSDAGFYDPALRLETGTLGAHVASGEARTVWAEGRTLYASEDDD